jgi:GDPmannose 4,6-dehydratase
LKFLISGITGQDGFFLSRHLRRLGHQVVGLSRKQNLNKKSGTFFLKNSIKIIHCSYEKTSIKKILRLEQPYAVINLAGQGYVAKSWTSQNETLRSVGGIPQYFLESILEVNPRIRFVQASSSQIYAPSLEILRETASIGPTTPYGCAKTYAHFMVKSYRETHGVFAVNAILFNHESQRRHSDFFSQKIVQGALKIKRGELLKLSLGNLKLVRDIGCADEFMDAVARMATMKKPNDFNICTGHGRRLRDLVEFVFSELNINIKKRISVDKNQIRRVEPPCIVGDPGKISRELGWKPKQKIEAVLAEMLRHAQGNG